MDGLLRNHQADTAAYRLQLERTLAQRQGDLRARTQELEDITIKYTEAQKVCMQACVHGCMCAGVLVCMCAWVHGACVPGCLCAWVHGCMCAWVHVCMCAWVHVCMCAWVHVCMCACVHGYMCAWVHGACVHGCRCALETHPAYWVTLHTCWPASFQEVWFIDYLCM